MTDVEGESYDEAYYQANDQDGDRPALWLYERIARRLAPAAEAVLEFGSGSGWYSKRLARSFRTHAYDVSAFARQRTRETSPTTTVHDDLDSIPANAFALVASLHVLEHLDDPSIALARFRTWLAPRGRLLYVVPNPDGWGRKLKGDDWFGYRDPTHCSLLSQGDWLAATSSAGFVDVKARADGLWDAPYVRTIPAPLQKAVFGSGAAATLLAGRAWLPPTWGECIVVTATRSD